MGINSYKGTQIFARVAGIFLLHLLFSCSVAWGQNNTVSGVITDANTGETLPGVNILIKGTNTGTASDSQGEYSLTTPSLTDTLTFSFIGYQTQEIPISGRNQIDVVLQSQTLASEELVVVGYGEQEREGLTGSVGSVDMESIDGQAITGANEALTGQIAGVQVNTTSGIPGGGPEINIRGVGAIGAGNSPLYVVDGYPLNTFDQNASQVSNPLNSIPPSDIASISVLKGPSATAIYGSRAANGVVQISTKEGQSGKANFQMDAYSGVQVVPNQMKPDMMNAREFAAFMNEWIVDNNRVTGSSIEIPEEYQNPSRYGEGTNWFEELTRVAPVQNINLSMSGGNEDIRSYLSANYVRQKGIVLGSDYNKVGLRANVTTDITPKLELGIRFSPSYSFGTLVDEGSRGRAGDTNADIGFFGLWEVLSPIESVYNSDGSYNALVGGPRMLAYQNPVQGLNTVKNESQTARIIGSGYFSYEIIDNVILKNSFNADWQNSKNNLFRPSVIGRRGQEPPTIPIGAYSQGGYVNWANEANITYDNTFKGGHSLNVLGGISVQRHVSDNGSFRGEQYPDDAIETLNAAPTITGLTNVSSWALASILGRINYSYQSRYLLTVTLRRDGSSKFGSEKRWGTFPSIALGWRISEESWMSDKFSWLSNLKLRGSYGITGNDQIGNFSYASQMGINNYIFGNSLAPGKTTNSLGNSGLTWQETEEYNIGADIGLLDSRVSITANYYTSTTKSLLLDVEIPQSSGFATALRNIGKVENRGFELSIKTSNIQKNNFSWDTNFNFSTNKNEVLALGPDGAPIIVNTAFGGIYGQSITQIGDPVGLFYGYNMLGLYQDQQDVENSPSYTDAVPGALKPEDINGDGQIVGLEDFTTIGNPYPDFTYGLTNTLTYNNLSLNVVATGSYGAEKFRGLRGSTHNIDAVFNVHKDLNNRWRSQEEPGNGKTPTTVGAQNRLIYRSISTLSIKNASYLWIKNIKLGYNVPKSIIGDHFKSLQIYGSVQNAFIITPYPGNPTAQDYLGGNSLSPGVDWNPYPIPRIMTVGIKLNI